MTTELLTGTTSPAARPGHEMPGSVEAGTAAEDGADARIVGLRCRNCGRAEALGPSYVCAGCFGPLEVAYDLDLIRPRLTRAAIAARPAGIWRYLELLPVARRPARSLAVGSTPLIAAERLGPAHRDRATAGQGRQPQPDPLVQGPGGRDRGRAGA